jgi:hypothetical protein
MQLVTIRCYQSKIRVPSPVSAKDDCPSPARDYGFGMMRFHGPYIFKWGMHDTIESWGPLSGSASISEGSYTEYNRMGTDAIKSSNCHPDALLGSGIKAPGIKAPIPLWAPDKRDGRHHGPRISTTSFDMIAKKNLASESGALAPEQAVENAETSNAHGSVGQWISGWLHQRKHVR